MRGQARLLPECEPLELASKMSKQAGSIDVQCSALNHEPRGRTGAASRDKPLPLLGCRQDHLLVGRLKLSVSPMAWPLSSRSSYTSVSTRSLSILRTLPSTATRLVMERAKLSGNQPVSPSRSRSPCSQPECRWQMRGNPLCLLLCSGGSRAWVTVGTDCPS